MLTPAERETLITSHLPFAGWYAKKFKGQGVPYEDLKAEANLALVKAADKFDPITHGAKFDTYAGYWIRSRLIRVCAAALQCPPVVNFKAGDLVGDDPEPDLDERTKILLHDAVATLPPRDRLIVTLRYGLGGQKPCTIIEIQKRARMSAHLVRRYLVRSLETIAVHLLSA